MAITYDAPSNTITVTGYTAGTPCTFEDIYQADQSGGWGVVSKLGSAQYLFDCLLYIGDGSTETHFKDNEKQVVFKQIAISRWTKVLWIKDNAHFTLGDLRNATKKLVDNGCAIFGDFNDKGYLPYTESNSELNLYASLFLGIANLRLDIRSSGAKIYGTNFIGAEAVSYLPSNSDIDAVNCYRTSFFRNQGNIENVLIAETVTTFEYRYGDTGTQKNVVVKDYTTLLRGFGFNGTVYLINIEVDGSWVVAWASTGNTGKFWRQYEFDVHAQDKEGNDLNGVSVVAEYKSPYGSAFSTTTDVNGNIATQTVDHGWFEGQYGSTEQVKAPLKVTYSKSGYQTVVKYYDMEEKTKDIVVMHRSIGVFLNVGGPVSDLVVNLKKTDPENKNVIVL